MLAAGIDGIERELPLPEPVEENLYHFTDEDLKRRNIPTLPATLGEAVAEMKADPVDPRGARRPRLRAPDRARSRPSGTTSASTSPSGSAIATWRRTRAGKRKTSRMAAGFRTRQAPPRF